jgi:dCMP deaminase
LKKIIQFVYYVQNNSICVFQKYFKDKNYIIYNMDLETKMYPRPNWDSYWMNIAEAVKERSPDYYKVGAVLVSLQNNRLVSTGYNGLPSGLKESSIDWSDRETVHNVVIHAEMNVLLYSNSMFDSSVLYTTTSPCLQCLKLLSAANIKKIIYKNRYRDIEKVIKLSEILGIELIEWGK